MSKLPDFDYSRLIGRIIERHGSRRAYAKKINLSLNSLSLKLRGKMAITTKDMILWSQEDNLDIPTEEWPEYFFKIKEN